MKKLTFLGVAALMAASSLSVVPASAAQFGLTKPSISADSSIVKVRDGCGYRRWRDRWGRCHWF